LKNIAYTDDYNYTCILSRAPFGTLRYGGPRHPLPKAVQGPPHVSNKYPTLLQALSQFCLRWGRMCVCFYCVIPLN